MKLSLLAASTSLLFASTHALDKCNYAVVAPNLHSLATPIAKCMTATGNSYNLARAAAPPTPEQAAAICSKCADFVKDVNALPPWPECTLNVGGSDQTLTTYFGKMIGGCNAGGGKSETAPTSPTTAPATQPSTTTPTKNETTGSVAGSSSRSEDKQGNGTASVTVTTPPSAASTTPVPSPTSDAVTTALAGATFVVAASMALLA